jgi:acylphosphatase
VSSPPGHTQRVRAHLRIRGRVQGVYFRAGLKRQADAHGVRGWARNLADGSVEALFDGTRDAVEATIAWARTGPPGAYVESVDVNWPAPADPPPSGFEVR